MARVETQTGGLFPPGRWKGVRADPGAGEKGLSSGRSEAALARHHYARPSSPSSPLAHRVASQVVEVPLEQDLEASS